MNCFARKLVSLLSIFALVSAQLAVSAYACPMQFMGMDEANTDVVALDVSVSEAVSTVPDAVSPALCQKHCQQGQHNVNDTSQPLAFASFTPIIVVTLLIDPITPPTATVPTPSLLRTTSPPLSISNCCFRI